MGKKGVLLDNGKSAKSSMALYWQNNKLKSKQPKQKIDHQQKDDQISDKRVMSNFQKWKSHKEKLITKAYTKPTQKHQDQIQLRKKQEENQQQMLKQLYQKKKPTVITHVPGFKSKSDLANKLQIQTAKQADQSTNVLRLPGHMGQMSQQQIVRMLRQRKSKQQMMNKYQQNKKTNHQHKQQQEDVILGQDFQNFLKKKQKQQQKKQQQSRIEEQIKQKQIPQSYFKSQILNKIEKQGVLKGLQALIPRKEIQKSPQAIDLNVSLSQANNNEIHQANSSRQVLQNAQKKDHHLIKPQFLPRVLKK